MNWYYVSNKKNLLFVLAISMSGVSSSAAMMQKFKNLFARKKDEPKIEEPFLKKVENTVSAQLDKHPGIMEKIKKNFTQAQLVCIGSMLGFAVGYAFKPLSSFNASVGLSSLLAGGQMLGLYDLGNVPLIKKVMDQIGTTIVAGGIVAISLPAGWLVCKNLPIAMALISGLLGYYIYKKQ